MQEGEGGREEERGERREGQGGKVGEGRERGRERCEKVSTILHYVHTHTMAVGVTTKESQGVLYREWYSES